MPRKRNGGDPPLIPINGGKKRRVRTEGEPQPHGGWLKRNRAEEPTRQPDIELPASFTTRKDGKPKSITSRSIKSGSLQDRAKAFYAVRSMTKLFNSLMRGLENDEPGAQTKVAKIYGLLSDGKGGVNVNVNQSQDNKNDNRSATITRSPGEASTPDEAYRLLAEERERRKTGVKQIEFVATPDEGYKPKVIEE